MKLTSIKAFGFVMIAALLGACSSDDSTTPQEDNNGRRMRQLTIQNVAMNTRAAINPSTYEATWETTDRPTYIILSAQPELRYGTLTPSAAGASTTLTGSVYCTLGDNIAIVLPTVTPELPANGSLSYPIDLSGQKGTLADIGARYHYIYGVGSVTSTDGATATGTISNTKSLLSLCKFTFTTIDGPVNVKSVQINYKSEYTGNLIGYPQTGTVSLANPASVSAEAGDPSGPLTVTLDKANAEGVVYVALFPCSKKLAFHFTVSDNDNNTYTATKNAKMLEGKYYEVPVTVE
ncbi:hypothetical protein [uncultured Prevotella sp.]|uniref:hypothetical protein n=1 Tax=uncultured Prevotella sp. TaxID=159272 RepID=UPI0025EF607C|nr:hypothetical protein [uncultured Prevotella sp.]